MLRVIPVVIAMLLAIGGRPATATDSVDPATEFKAFRDYFTKKFPNVPLNDFVNGPYSMDADLRKQWEAIDDFPPYDFAVDRGKGHVRHAIQERQDLRRLLRE